MKSFYHRVVPFVLIGLTSFPSLGLAERKCKVQARADTCRIRLYPGSPVTLSFDNSILRTDEPEREQWSVTARVEEGSDTLTLSAPKDANRAKIDGVLVVGTREYTVHAVVQLASTARDADQTVRIEGAGAFKVFQTAVRAKAQLIAATQTAAVEKRHAEERKAQEERHKAEITAENDKRAREVAAAKQAGERKLEEHRKASEERAQSDRLRLESKSLLNQISSEPACSNPLNPGYSTRQSPGAELVKLHLSSACWDEEQIRLLVPFEVGNHGPKPFRPIKDVTVTGHKGESIPAQITYVDRPTKEESEVVAAVGVDEWLHGVVAIEFGAKPLDKIRIRFQEPDQARWLEASVATWDVLKGIMPSYTGHDWAREVAYQEAREARAQQIILGPSGAIGACWVADAPDGGNLEATRCTMLGMRLTKGITELFAFDAGGLGGWTDGSGPYSAKFGRVTLSGVLRFGRWTIPYVRAGVGAQIASVNESSEAGFLLAAGAGVDRRLGNNVMIGAGLSFENSLTDGNRFRVSFGLGFHVSVGWTIDTGPAKREIIR